MYIYISMVVSARVESVYEIHTLFHHSLQWEIASKGVVLWDSWLVGWLSRYMDI